VGILLIVLFLLYLILSIKDFNLVKIRLFECGFISLYKVQVSFRIHFFVIIVLFIIFDLEIVLILGFLISDSTSILLFYFIFIFILLGFYFELLFGKLI
jgi:NADH:ubiquinone oxidoreductase subunit 3 (subunit A)